MATTRRTRVARPTLREVAALAGVSTKTASRVVNRQQGVVPDKVAAVQKAIRQLDYRPDLAASSLRRADGRTTAIAALLEDLANPFSAVLHRALSDAAHDRGFLIFAGSLDESADRERQLVRDFTARRVDALVIAPAGGHQGYLRHEVPDDTPVVFVDRLPVGFDADAVVTDNEPGARAGVEHLVAHGHRRIAFLGDLRSISTARDRYDGYAAALAAHGLPVHPHLVVHELKTTDKAAEAMAGLLDAAEPPTAVFAAQNNITVGVLRCLLQRGLERDVAVLGFDDFPLAELLVPGVSVMAQDPGAIGATAADIVFSRLAGDESPARTVVLPTRLIARGSGEIPAPP